MGWFDSLHKWGWGQRYRPPSRDIDDARHDQRLRDGARHTAREAIRAARTQGNQDAVERLQELHDTLGEAEVGSSAWWAAENEVQDIRQGLVDPHPDQGWLFDPRDPTTILSERFFRAQLDARHAGFGDLDHALRAVERAWLDEHISTDAFEQAIEAAEADLEGR